PLRERVELAPAEPRADDLRDRASRSTDRERCVGSRRFEVGEELSDPPARGGDLGVAGTRATEPSARHAKCTALAGGNPCRPEPDAADGDFARASPEVDDGDARRW